MGGIVYSPIIKKVEMSAEAASAFEQAWGYVRENADVYEQIKTQGYKFSPQAYERIMDELQRQIDERNEDLKCACEDYTLVWEKLKLADVRIEFLESREENMGSIKENTDLLPMISQRIDKLVATVNRVWGETYTNLCKNVKNCWDVLKTRKKEFSKKITQDTINSTIAYFEKMVCYGCKKDADDLNALRAENEEEIKLEIDHMHGPWKNGWKDSAVVCGPCNKRAEYDEDLRAEINETAKGVKKLWEIKKPKPTPHPQCEMDLET